MSYVLINGKRYYKDDRTGKITLDNVSQAAADRRSRRNKGAARTTAHTGFLWKAVIVCIVISLFVGAFLYNRSHVSSEEQAITNYMNAQQEQAMSDMAE